MVPRALFAAAALALAATGLNALSYDAKVTQYTVQTAEVGSCRLKGISTSSDNFKFYASVSSKDVLLQEGCARCIKVTKEGLPSLTAYVIDVCQGCKSGELKLSSAGLSALSIDPNLNNATATYKFVNCPSNLLSGSVSACLMEGASNSYIPLQFYNSNKVVASATISGINAMQSKDSYFFYATPNTGNDDKAKWFQNVQVSLTSKDGETQSGTFQFSGTSGCTTSTFQFARSTADGEADDDGDAAANGGTSSDGSKSGFLVPVIIGVVAALLVIVAAVFFVRRRRASKYDDDRFDHENQFNSPVAKGPAFPPVSPGRPTYAADNSMHNSTDDPSDGEPNSPAGAFDDAVTPTTVEAANRRVFETINQQRLQQQMEQQQQQQQQQAMAAAPKVAYNTYVAPQTYSYSKPVEEDRGQKNTSFRGSTRAVPTFPAPKLPTSHSQDGDSGDEGRSSFDVDDMRETEEIKERERMSSMGGDVRQYAAYSTDAYAAPTVTSPQSYVRATTLRRASTKVPTERPTLRFTTSAPPVPAEEERRSDSFQFADRQDSYSSDLARDTKTSSGYSRESLGILGYPYAKKNSSRGSLTGKNQS